MASILLVAAFFSAGNGGINIKKDAYASAYSSSFSSSTSSCDNNMNGCVIFRLDNIQDWWEHDVQTAILDTFLQTQTKVTPALVMVNYGNDTNIVDKIKQGEKGGLFEVAMQGWEHDDYGLKSFDKQKVALTSANDKLALLNSGVRSNIFVPPYNSINQDTVYVMKQINLTILSADLVAHNGGGYLPATFPNRTSLGITSIPFTVNFIDDHRPPSSNGKTMEELIGEINVSIVKHGYAVVLAQPADFALYDTNIIINNNSANRPIIQPRVNSTQIDTLRAVIAQLKASGKTITSFNELAGLPRAPWPTEMPITKDTELPSASSSQQQQQLPPPVQDVQNQQPPKPILDDYRKPSDPRSPNEQSSLSSSPSSSSSPIPSPILQFQQQMDPLITAARTATVWMMVIISAIVIVVIVAVAIAIRRRRSSSLPALPYRE